jgi:hypothetical protein
LDWSWHLGIGLVTHVRHLGWLREGNGGLRVNLKLPTA